MLADNLKRIAEKGETTIADRRTLLTVAGILDDLAAWDSGKTYLRLAELLAEIRGTKVRRP